MSRKRPWNHWFRHAEEQEHSIYSTSSEEFVGSVNNEEFANRNYFNDNKREIDFVLVCNEDTFNFTKQRSYIIKFIQNLEKNGLQFELETGLVCNNLIFIKVHGPYNVLLRYASAYKIRLAFQSHDRPKQPSVRFKFMTTDLTKADPNGPIFYRAKETMSGERPMKIASTERIMIVEKLLSRAQFGNTDREHGLGKLLQRKVFVAAYPLHCGTWEWTDKGPLNDRQLLAHYWARITLWYKQQPLTVIEKYYGPEVAFYFAFYGFYNKMLIPASIVGLLCFIYGNIIALVVDKIPTEEICNSNLPLCPAFFKERNWKFTPLKKHCLFSKFNYMFDNSATVVFAFFMAFWATIFMELWKRKHAVLMYRWNLKSTDQDTSWRQEFEECTKYRRICPVTGNFEPYIPTWLNFFHYSITCVTCVFMIIIVVMAVIASIIYRLMFTEIIKITNGSVLAMSTGAILSVLFIKIFGKWYSKISLWLTRKENPRTQSEFDDSYIYKIFLLSFVNNYAAVAYMAFVKGKLFTHPGNVRKTMFQNVMQGDLCPPTGCIMALCVQLAFIMLLKSLVGNIFTLFFPVSKNFYRQYIRKDTSMPYKLPQWELDYDLKEMGHYFLVGEYSEMIMQYGFVTFFVAAFPLAPLCAFINNMIELRTDANKFVRYCRRPVPVRISGLQAWNGILQAMTFVSLVTNAFVIAFTSDFVKRSIYRHYVDFSLKGYVNSTLSIFSMADLKQSDLGLRKDTINGTCYYRGDRYPPDHPHKYQLTSDFWYELCMRFVMAVVFEHVILMLTGILAYAIPDMPYSLKKFVKYQRYKRKQARVQMVDKLGKGSQQQSPSVLDML